MKDRPTILITCGDGPGVFGHVDAARNNACVPVRIVVGDVSDDANIGFALADEAVRIPRASDPDLVEKLLAVCTRSDVDVVWPVFDGELEPLAATRSRFEAEGIRLLLADEATIRLCLDKASFYHRLSKTGWVPPAQVVQSPEELRSAAEGFGHPRRPVVVKPVRATGGRGYHVLGADRDAAASFFADRPGATRFALTTALQAMASRNGTAQTAVMVMPFLGGAEYGCDVLAESGQVVAAVTRHKRGPVRDGMHTRIVVDELPRVISLAADLVGEIHADGLLSIDLRDDDDGHLRVLEVNPRAGAYLGMACARIDLFGLSLARLSGREMDVGAARRCSEPVVGLRYWADRVRPHPQTSGPQGEVCRTRPASGVEHNRRTVSGT